MYENVILYLFKVFLILCVHKNLYVRSVISYLGIFTVFI